MDAKLKRILFVASEERPKLTKRLEELAQQHNKLHLQLLVDRFTLTPNQKDEIVNMIEDIKLERDYILSHLIYLFDDLDYFG